MSTLARPSYIDSVPPLSRIPGLHLTGRLSCLQAAGPDATLPAVPLPAPSSGAQVAAFGFDSVDVSATTHTCTLSHSGPPALDPAAGLPKASNPAWTAVNTEYPCTSPEVFYALPAGAYAFSVYGTDSVGNREAVGTSRAFNVVFESGTMYTRIRDGVWGPTAASGLAYELEAVQGTADGLGGPAPPGTQFEYQLSFGQSGEWTTPAWQAVTGSSVSFEVRARSLAHRSAVTARSVGHQIRSSAGPLLDWSTPEYVSRTHRAECACHQLEAALSQLLPADATASALLAHWPARSAPLSTCAGCQRRRPVPSQLPDGFPCTHQRGHCDAHQGGLHAPCGVLHDDAAPRRSV